jgi:hypothetical protein
MCTNIDVNSHWHLFLDHAPVYTAFMALDVKKTIERIERRELEKKSDRGRVVLYLSKSLTKEFQKLCKANGISASKLVEEFMRESLSNKKT